MPVTPVMPASRLARIGALVVAAAAFSPLAAQSGAQAAAPAPVVFVTPAWLAERLSDPSVVVLHVAQNRHEYLDGHVAGARFLWPGAAVRSTPDVSVELPPLAQLDSLLEVAGVSDRSRIVLYGSGPTTVARAFMTLEYAGLAGRVSILDGGLAAWREEGKPVETGERPVARGKLTLHPQRDVVVDAAWVQSHAGQSSVAVLDARSPEFYTGANAGGMPRPGRIPSAVNIPFTSLMGAQGKLKDTTALRELFTAAGVRPGQEVVTYCHIGLQGSLLYAAARQLGHPAHLYDGSFEDWSHNTSFPVATGDKK